MAAHHIAAPANRTVVERWWFRVVVVLALATPVASTRPVAGPEISLAVAEVLRHPAVEDMSLLKVVSKWALPLVVAVALSGMGSPRTRARIVLGYYAASLVAVAALQNLSTTTSWGTVYLTGNAIVQVLVAVVVVRDLIAGRSRLDRLRRERLWVLIPAAFAWLFPYTIGDHVVLPGMTAGTLINSAAVTYCMLTPVILAVLVLFADTVHRPTLSIASFVGLVFGLINLVMWFVIHPASWWMGVCHLPLFLISSWGVLLARRR